MTDYKMWIGGAWVDAASGERFETINPYTGKAWATIPRGTKEDADRAVTAAHRAFRSKDWRSYGCSDEHIARHLHLVIPALLGSVGPEHE